MGHLGVVLYEYLGEEYPEVLGSILGALKAIVNVIGAPPLLMLHFNIWGCREDPDSCSCCRNAQDDPSH